MYNHKPISLPEIKATTTDGVTTSYYFDNTELAWYDADVDGNRLIGF